MANDIVSRQDCLQKGLDRYFTGKPCKHGHITHRWPDGSCFECRRIINNGQYAKFRERKKAAVADYYRRNKKKCIAAAISWQKRNWDLVREIHRAWSKANPEKVLASARTQRAKRKGAIGSHTPRDFAEIVKQQDNRCKYCLREFSDKVKIEVDHIIPIRMGGTNFKENIQAACSTCNKRKSDKDPAEFAKEMKLWLAGLQ